MFRRRGATGGREGDIGLADVAVAVLGPVAFLWIVFQGFAAINSRGCVELTQTEVAELAGQLKTWHGDQRRGIELLDGELERRACPRVPTPASPPNAPELVPDKLQNVCRISRSEVLKAAGLPEGALASLAADRQARTDALAACTKGGGGCVSLATPAERRQRVGDIKDWFEARGQLRDSAKRRLGQDCPLINASATNLRPGVPSVPPVLADLCASDRAIVYAGASIEPASIDRQEREIEDLHRAHLACAAPAARDEAGCRPLRDLKADERQRLQTELMEWRAQLQTGVVADERLLKEKRCPEAAPAAARDGDIEPLRRHNICPAAYDSLIGIARVSEGLNDLMARRVALDASLRSCVGGIDTASSCPRLDDTALAERAVRLKIWLGRAETQLAEARRQALQCGGAVGPTEATLGSIEPLADLCPPERARVLARTDVNGDRVKTVADDLARAELSLHRCQRTDANATVTDNEQSIRFISCTTDFTLDDNSNVKMRDADADAHFETTARRILQRLNERPFNRIDVLGHTDSTQIHGSCPGTLAYVNNNALLSYLRASRFKEELLRAVERLALTDVSAARTLARLDGHYQDLEKRPLSDVAAQRILARLKPYREKAMPLRLYAIGVGSAEPVHKDIAEYSECKSVTDEARRTDCKYGIDRRIEFRFVGE